MTVFIGSPFTRFFHSYFNEEVLMHKSTGIILHDVVKNRPDSNNRGTIPLHDGRDKKE
jgi:hypothetical protein